MKKFVLAGIILALAHLLSASQPTDANVNMDSLKFLIGKWTGESGGGEPGTASGYFTFESALQGKALIRKNHAKYAAIGDSPAVLHDDLMILYVEPGTKQIKAFYTDTEDNVINYQVSVSSDGKTVVFLSEPKASGAGYRLTYAMTERGVMLLTFEVTADGKQFQKFVEGKVRKSANLN
jgi:hypothetical protein